MNDGDWTDYLVAFGPGIALAAGLIFLCGIVVMGAGLFVPAMLALGGVR